MNQDRHCQGEILLARFIKDILNLFLSSLFCPNLLLFNCSHGFPIGVRQRQEHQL